jgi:hypothetical protein
MRTPGKEAGETKHGSIPWLAPLLPKPNGLPEPLKTLLLLQLI